jgi:hypothetical protein
MPTTMTLVSDRDPILVGMTVRLTATVQPSGATGTIEFFEFGQRFGAAEIVNGEATIDYPAMTLGSRTLSASYAGNANYGPCSGFIVEHVLPKTSTILSLQSSENPTLAGRTVTLTATVIPATVSGAVDLFDSGAPLGNAKLSHGVATMPYVFPASGLRTLSAHYPGDTAHAASDVTYLQQVYTRFPTTLTFMPSANPSPRLDVEVTAQVSPAPPNADLTLADDDGPLGTMPLVNGTVTFPYHAPRFATRTITGSYSGNSDYTSVQRVLSLDFRGIATSTMMRASPPTAVVGDSVAVSAMVQPSGATGTVEFRDSDGRLLGTVPLIDGKGTMSHRFDTIWSGTLWAHYSGDTAFTESLGSLVFGVAGHTTTTSISSSGLEVVDGTHVRFTANVSPAAEIGDVWFTIDGSTRSIAPIHSGVATYNISTLTTGVHSVSAWYTGGGLYASSGSIILTEKVIATSQPFLRVFAPNDGESWTVGSPVEIRWDAASTSVAPRVDIELSRSVPPRWETIASNVPNTGSYSWVVTAPGTNTGATPVMSALVSIVDQSGRVGSDASDLPFSIFDPQTDTELIRLDAQPFDGGVRIRWALSDAADLASIELQRATSAAGPWNAVTATLRDDNGETVAEDRSAAMGGTYLYRLVATTLAGAQRVFGPVSVPLAAPTVFGLSAAWPNPSPGAIRFQFDVARPARVTLSILDPAGRAWATLVDGELSAGRHDALWDGRSARGPAPAGIYFARLETPEGAFVRRLAITH